MSDSPHRQRISHAGYLLARIVPLVAGASTLAGGVASAQWSVVPTHAKASFRGLSVAPDGTVWVGGTEGTVLRSRDRGMTWEADSVSGAHSFDFRGVAAIDSTTAYAMTAGTDTARIYKTTDGGATWVLQFKDERPGVFLDGIGCWDSRRCLAAGDPIDGRFLVVTTADAGAHWTTLASSAAPRALPGEGAFAASNSSVLTGRAGRAWIATGGGSVARVWRSLDYGATWTVADVPGVAAGIASAGIFSLAFCGERDGVAVGGDYRAPGAPGAHVALTYDGGATWTAGDTARGTPYLSGAACADPRARVVVAVGPRGTVVSRGDGQVWTHRDAAGWNAVAAVGDRLVAVGASGMAARAAVADFETR